MRIRGRVFSHKSRNKLILSLFWVLFVQCKPSSRLETVLEEAADKRAELEYALAHYTAPQDSLKRQAVEFFVENLPPEQYNKIDEELIIQNTDLAFEVWKKPWAKEINFEQFKELILPFDLLRDSSGVFWRERFLKEYAYIEDSLVKYPNTPPAKVACMLINAAFQKKYVAEFDRDKRNVLDLNDWERLRNGDCSDMAYLTNHVMHALGVPTAIEFTPQWANISYRHFWNVVWMQGRFFPFAGTEGYPGQYKVDLETKYNFWKKRTTVFRQGYRINPNSLVALTSQPVPPLLNIPTIIDVSKEVLSTRSITCKVPESVNDDYLYLCVVHRESWYPVAWAKNAQQQAVFQAVNPGVVYVLARFDGRRMILLDDPFLLQKNGQCRTIKPQLNRTEQVTCDRKFPYDDTNLVKIGDTYQLLYWDREGWQTVAKQVATTTHVTFNKVPRGALLLLKDLTRGRQERVFLYQNGEQIF
jgi:hypothetical protein